MISEITVDSHHANFSIFPARRAGTYASTLIKQSQAWDLLSKILSKIGQKKRIAGKKNRWKKSKIDTSLLYRGALNSPTYAPEGMYFPSTITLWNTLPHFIIQPSEH